MRNIRHRCSRRAGRSRGRFHPPSGARRIEKRASVKPHSVFLRKECVLPERLDPLREPVGENWTLVEEITAPVLDTMIRRMGWHFMCGGPPLLPKRLWVNRGQMRPSERWRAPSSDLARRYNAAELVSVQTRRQPGFHIAIVTLQPRLIQGHTWLDIADEGHPLAVPAR